MKTYLSTIYFTLLTVYSSNHFITEQIIASVSSSTNIGISMTLPWIHQWILLPISLIKVIEYIILIKEYILCCPHFILYPPKAPKKWLLYYDVHFCVVLKLEEAYCYWPCVRVFEVYVLLVAASCEE